MLRNITGIDHLGVDPGDIWRAFAQLSRLGFVVSTPSRFKVVPVESCQVTFPGHFLSISTTYMDSGHAEGAWASRMKPAGTTELMIGTANVQELKAELAEEHPHILRGSMDAEVERRTYIKGEILHQKFKILVLPPGAIDGIGVVGFCEHATRDLVWRPELLCHPNGAKSIRVLTIVHNDPPSLAPIYSTLFAAAPARASSDQYEFDIAGITMRFVTQPRFDSLRSGPREWIQLSGMGLRMIEMEVDDLDLTQEYLDFMGVESVLKEFGRLYVNPQCTGEWALCFIDRRD